VQQGDQCKRVSVDGASNDGDAQRLTWCQPSAVAAAARATVNAQPVTPLASTHNLDRTVKDDVADEWRQTLMVNCEENGDDDCCHCCCTECCHKQTPDQS